MENQSANLCASWGPGCGPRCFRAGPHQPWPAKSQSTGCAGEKPAVIFRRVIHRKIHRSQPLACGKPVRRGGWPGLFPSFGTDPWRLSRHADLSGPTHGGTGCGRSGRLGYPSRVCSITGAAIDRIAAAIDQLASDARGEGGEPPARRARRPGRRVCGRWSALWTPSWPAHGAVHGTSRRRALVPEGAPPVGQLWTQRAPCGQQSPVEERLWKTCGSARGCGSGAR